MSLEELLENIKHLFGFLFEEYDFSITEFTAKRRSFHHRDHGDHRD